MKNVKWFLPVIVVCFGLFTFTSCNNGDFDFEPDGQDQFVDDFDDDFDDDSDNDSGSSSSDNGGDSGGASLDPDGGIAMYRVDGQNIIKTDSRNVNPNWMNDEVKHNDIWNMVTTLIPADKRRWMTTFEIFDGGGQLLGYVYNATQDLTSWNFALGIDSAYPDGGQTLDTSGDFLHTVIHEYGHIMSLNDEQLNPNTSSCDYNPGEGCARSDSYLQGFYNRFWADIANEHSSIGQDDYDALEEFYSKYQDRFVSDYAATNPVEDLAEVFSFFITMENQPTGNQIKDEKVRYLYEFPELVDLRNHMKESTFTMPQPGKWKRPTCNKHRHTNIALF